MGQTKKIIILDDINFRFLIGRYYNPNFKIGILNIRI